MMKSCCLNSQSMPKADVSDKFAGSVSGVMDYSFGNFKLEVLEPPVLVSSGLLKEVAKPTTAYQLQIATFNVENLAPSDPAVKFATLANQIVANLGAPDILAIEEIQDNNGTLDTGVVDASTTWTMLIAAIQAAGGPTYSTARLIRSMTRMAAPRAAIFARASCSAPTGASRSSNTRWNLHKCKFGERDRKRHRAGIQSGSCGPNNAAFTDSRKPLAAEFTFKGDKVFVIANHFNSKSGDQPLFGHFQPPAFLSEVQRLQQAQVVHDFVADILAADPNANVVVLAT